MRSLYFIAPIVALVAAPCHAQSTIKSAGAGATIPVPQGWRTVAVPGLANKVAIGAVSDGFAPNLVLIEEPFAGTVADYADINRKAQPKMSPGAKFLGKTAFVTKSGVSGIKMAYSTMQQGKSLRQVFSLFPVKAGTMLCVTASSPASDGTKYDAAIDVAMHG